MVSDKVMDNVLLAIHAALCVILGVTYSSGNNNAECPDGGMIYTDSYNTICYWIVQSKQKADPSEQKCVLDGGHLAIVPYESASDTLYSFISSTNVGSGWLFLGYTETQGSLTVRHTGESQMWAHWDKGEPNDYKGKSERCVAIQGGNGKWHDIPCTWSKNALCSKSFIPDTTTEEPTTITTTTTTEKPTTTTTTTTETPTTTTTTTTETPTTTTTTTDTPTTTTTTTDTPTTTTTTTETPTTTTTTTEKPTTTTTTTETPTTTSKTETPTTTTTTTEKPTTTTTTTETPTTTSKTETPTTTTTTTVKPTTTNTITTEKPTTTSGPIDCLCLCDQSESMEIRLEKMKIDKETLSSTIRKRISVSDPRPSAAYVGYVSIGIMSLVFGGIFLMDLLKTMMG